MNNTILIPMIFDAGLVATVAAYAIRMRQSVRKAVRHATGTRRDTRQGRHLEGRQNAKMRHARAIRKPRHEEIH